jgi:hypothetical protein
MTSRPTCVSLGPYDPFKRVPTLSFQDGKVTFIPGRGSPEFATIQTQFPSGARLENRIEMGDLYLTDDHSLHLSSSLWVVRPDGTRELLAQGFTIYIHRRAAARNLERAGIPFKVVSFYQEPNGHVVENEIKITRSRLGSASVVLLGTSSIWLGALTAFLTHDLRYVVSIGVVGLCALAIAITKGGSSNRSGLLKVVSIIPSYVGGYALAVVVIRHLFR